MPLPSYSDGTGEEPARRSDFGRSWTQPSSTMQEDKGLRSGSDPDCEPFTTIDDCLQQAQDLFAGLKRLSEYKRPLDIRRGVGKGVKKSMTDNQPSKQLNASGRTYFLDVQKTREGKSYLRITESRKGEGDRFERNSINVFPEDAKEFAQAVSEMTAELE